MLHVASVSPVVSPVPLRSNALPSVLRKVSRPHLVCVASELPETNWQSVGQAASSVLRSLRLGLDATASKNK